MSKNRTLLMLLAVSIVLLAAILLTAGIAAAACFAVGVALGWFGKS